MTDRPTPQPPRSSPVKAKTTAEPEAAGTPIANAEGDVGVGAEVAGDLGGGANAATGADSSPAPEVPAAPAGGLRILLAEDEALIRLDLAEMLEEAGHQVVGQAGDGEQALALARELRPDLVVMDIKMPGMDGLSAAEVLGREAIAPVVMLTAFSDKTLVERARDAGVMAYVVKPFTAADVLPAIEIARPRWQEFQAVQGEVADLEERFETRKRLDRAKGVLMQQSKLSEAQAFRWIQKAAMDRRLSMREVADAVIEQFAPQG